MGQAVNTAHSEGNLMEPEMSGPIRSQGDTEDYSMTIRSIILTSHTRVRPVASSDSDRKVADPPHIANKVCAQVLVVRFRKVRVRWCAHGILLAQTRFDDRQLRRRASRQLEQRSQLGAAVIVDAHRGDRFAAAPESPRPLPVRWIASTCGAFQRWPACPARISAFVRLPGHGG